MSETRFGAADAVVSRMPSPAIWNDCPVQSIRNDPAKGQHIFDDFKNSQVMTSNTTITTFTSGVGQVQGDVNWYAYQENDAVADIAVQTDDEGWLLLQNDGTDAHVAAIATGSNVEGRFCTPTAGRAKKLWFEARVKVVSITNSDDANFIGLCAPGECKDAGGAMAAGGASMSDVDYVGFAKLSGDCDDLTLVYNEATLGTAQSDTGVITLAAITWIRIGFKVVTKSQGTYLQWYADGEYLGSAYDVDLTHANANWPSTTNMAALISHVGGSGVGDGDGIYIDWVRVAQEY